MSYSASYCYQYRRAMMAGTVSADALLAAAHRLKAVSHRLVRSVAREESPVGQALLCLVFGGRSHWLYGEWLAELAALDVSSLTVGEWLQARENRF